VSRSESTHSTRVRQDNEKENEKSDNRAYPGSLHRNQRKYSVPGQFHSMLDVEDPPSLKAANIPQNDSMESLVDGKLSQTTTQSSTSSLNDQANISFFDAAANGVAPAAPTRAPAPVPNGKAVSPPEVPQSVSSTDPKVAAQQASDMRNIVRRKLTGYVGFANLPNQWHRKSVRKGFNFNVMVVGTFNCAPVFILRSYKSR
jgi:septin 7